MDADGSNKTNLTPSAAFTGSTATPSPDGSKIAFQRYSGINNSLDIFMMNSDGTNQVNLTNTSSVYEGDGDIQWSPDGQRILFIAGPPLSGAINIFTMNADGTNYQNMSNGIEQETNQFPSWSLDGSKIVFQSSRAFEDEDMKEIYLMNSDGANQTRLTNSPNNHSAKFQKR